MVYRGQVENGKIVLDENVSLPEGAEVHVVLRNACAAEQGDTSLPGSIEDQIAAIWADMPATEWDSLPCDLSDNLDHYVYGTPQK